MKQAHEYLTPALQVAWKEFHKSPNDFVRVEPYFIDALSDGSLQARHHYAKFIEQFDKQKARQMFHNLSKEHETSELFYARNLVFYGKAGDRRRGIALMRMLCKKGNLVAKFFLALSISKALPLHKKIIFAPCQTVKVVVAMYHLIRNQDRARREMWGS